MYKASVDESPPLGIDQNRDGIRAWIQQSMTKDWGKPMVNRPNKSELNPIRALYANVWKLHDRPKLRKQWEFNGAWPNKSGQQRRKMSLPTEFRLDPIRGLSANGGDQKLIRPGEYHHKWLYPSSLRTIRWGGYPKMRGNCSTHQRPGNCMNSVGRDQKLIRSGDYHNECIHQV